MLVMETQQIVGPYGSGLGVGYPVLPNVVGMAEMNVFQMDLLFFALFIPAGAIAALGISGGGYIIRNLIWTEGIFVTNDFLRGIRRNYWNVLEAVLFVTVMLFLARTMGNLADWLVVIGSTAKGWLIASKIVGYILVAFSILIGLWMISLGINYKQSPWALFRNAVVMTIGTFPQTIIFAALATWPVFLTMFGGSVFVVIGVLILMFLGISYALLLGEQGIIWASGNMHDLTSMYLMLVPFTYFLVGALLQVQRTPSYLCRFLRQSSLLIYVSHILFAMPLLALFPDHHLLVYGAVIVCAQLLAVVIIALSNRFSWLKVLC